METAGPFPLLLNRDLIWQLLMWNESLCFYLRLVAVGLPKLCSVSESQAVLCGQGSIQEWIALLYGLWPFSF